MFDKIKKAIKKITPAKKKAEPKFLVSKKNKNTKERI